MSKVFNKIEGKITAGKIEKGVDKLKNTSLEELSKQLDKVDRGELRKKISELDVEKIKEMKIDVKEIKSDVQGSYTGVAEDPYEKPVQDADDL